MITHTACRGSSWRVNEMPLTCSNPHAMQYTYASISVAGRAAAEKGRLLASVALLSASASSTPGTCPAR